MREIRNKLKISVNRIELAKDFIEDQIDKIDFDKAINLLQETISSLEEIKNIVAEKINK